MDNSANIAASETFAKKLDAWIPGMGATSIPARRLSQQKLQNALWKLGGGKHQDELAAACKAIAERLDRKMPRPAKIWLLRQLEFNGGAESVDAIAKLLDSQEPLIQDAACRALAANPSPTANDSLLKKLRSLQGNKKKIDAKIALLNALGFRANEKSVATIAAEMCDPDVNIAGAAAHALGCIGNAESAQALASLRTRGRVSLRRRITDAYLRCADNMLQNGKKNLATSIYLQLDKPRESKATRMGARHGLLRVKAANKKQK